MKAWTSAEVAFLEEWTGTRRARWIAQQLTRRFGRVFSEHAVINKQKRLGFSSRVRGDGMTMSDLELALGVHHRIIASWVREGKLRCRRRTSDRTPEQGGPAYEFLDVDILAFIRRYRTLIRLDRVDAEWFLGLVLPPRARESGGHRGGATSPAGVGTIQSF
jgi:hypothetical protein